jgi:hypothetical protein
MEINLFGWSILKSKEKTDLEERAKSFVLPEDDGNTSIMVDAGMGVFGQYLDLEGTAKNESDLVKKYRAMVYQPETDTAIEEITNEAIVMNENNSPVTIVLDKVEISEKLKEKIRNEFDEILKLLNFNFMANEIFRRWYIDGRLYYHLVIDSEHPDSGIIDIRPIDPTRLKKVQEIERNVDRNSGAEIIKQVNEYYIYDHLQVKNSSGMGLRIAKDSITFVPSGLYDQAKRMTISYLHKAIKPLNQLRMIEDAAVIYRLARAPERRVFYIDVGNLPKGKAEQQLKEIMMKYKNKIVYDASTGEVKDDKKHMSMIEDFWLPRREGRAGTEIDTLSGGANLGDIEDIEYFKKLLSKSLNIPVSRLDPENGFSLGRSTEISREELKLDKFIGKLRRKFSTLFSDILRKQLILKKIISADDWDIIKNKVFFLFETDSHFTELKETELLNDRLNVLGIIDDYVGKYYSVEWVRKKVLRQTEEDIINIDKQIEAEIKSGKIEKEEDEDFGDDEDLGETTQMSDDRLMPNTAMISFDESIDDDFEDADMEDISS